VTAQYAQVTHHLTIRLANFSVILSGSLGWQKR
jgi:hypothetical protein